MVRVTIFMLLALTEADKTEKKKTSHLSKDQVGTPQASELRHKTSQLREAMLSSYCPTHAESMPCKSFLFMKKLRTNGKSPDEKKKLLLERQNMLAAMSPDEKKAMQTQTKDEFRRMYSAYCDESSPSQGKNAEVCTNSLFKSLYGNK
mmetsp:Transcript_61512/g.102353  ORF Transcript_61512/g.102353 Transcript_61512/m.102353 type:complete len:148 (+) Transcript_61512:36-479(+)|eukprot:CAMPEP_0119301060 /NCGR_PEP_ID=MMETSP1333-20130426/2911_1 /TAXON_ID=418940 /ORGANISM="Scyphosphaera apsteinii, Strain RCC1455" /LENGTH=147 /DNA_ID=CAMNT_0007303033 /DNA_START=36 /DNA_END=479 /DNA_ORIENTATION=+